MTQTLSDVIEDRLIRRPQVEELTGLTTPTLYREMKAGRFPAAVVLGSNMRAWRLSEIQTWMRERIEARDTGADKELRTVNKNIGKGRPKRAQQAA